MFKIKNNSFWLKEILAQYIYFFFCLRVVAQSCKCRATEAVVTQLFMIQLFIFFSLFLKFNSIICINNLFQAF